MPKRRGPDHRRAEVVALLQEGLSDNAISKKLRLSRKYVGQLRLEAGVLRSNRKWTREAVLELARWWFEEFGVLSANDWNVAQLRAIGDKERVKRFYKYRAPHLNTVQRLFGGWNEMKRQAGLPDAPSGGAGHRRPYRKTAYWTRERQIERGQWWFRKFGVLSVSDWDVYVLRKQNDTIRLKRTERHKFPSKHVVIREFGSWSNFKREAGIPSPPVPKYSRQPRKK